MLISLTYQAKSASEPCSCKFSLLQYLSPKYQQGSLSCFTCLCLISFRSLLSSFSQRPLLWPPLKEHPLPSIPASLLPQVVWFFPQSGTLCTYIVYLPIRSQTPQGKVHCFVYCCIFGTWNDNAWDTVGTQELLIVHALNNSYKYTIVIWGSTYQLLICWQELLKHHPHAPGNYKEGKIVPDIHRINVWGCTDREAQDCNTNE